MATYDESVIEAAAGALYSRAASIVMSYTVIGFIVGAVSGALLGSGSPLAGFAWIVGAIAGGYIGWWQAQGAAFMLRLQAQTALCQVQIEKNTRSVAPSRMAAAAVASPPIAKPVIAPAAAPVAKAAAEKAVPAQAAVAKPRKWWRS